jgi:ubiquinone/menaquinone biosynthesis C-methylase UbiE
MTSTRADEAVRTFVHGMWANVASAWELNADAVDERATTITGRMLDAVGLRVGERVLELASGPGGVGLAAAERVGDGGEVVISDVVPAMVEIAHKRAAARGLTNVRTEILDLEGIDRPNGTFEVVLCREGMMFAVDPAHAACEMHRVLVPGGRVAVAVWASRQDNPWLGLLLDAITEATGIVVPPPGVPGPFALSHDQELQQLFIGAGFSDITLEHVATPLRAPSFDAWWTRNLTIAGPVVGVLNGLDDTTRARVRAAVYGAVSVYETDGALELPGSAVVLTGSRS